MSIWQQDLPRTTTRKLKRFEIEKRVRELLGKGSDAEIGVERPLTDDEQAWLEREDVRRALAIVEDASRNKLDSLRPGHNLELDLGLDSMQRVELLTALEQQLGGEVPEAQLAEVYTVAIWSTLFCKARRQVTVDGSRQRRMVQHFQRAGY